MTGNGTRALLLTHTLSFTQYSVYRAPGIAMKKTFIFTSSEVYFFDRKDTCEWLKYEQVMNSPQNGRKKLVVGIFRQIPAK